jgi:hypothetical protein
MPHRRVVLFPRWLRSAVQGGQAGWDVVPAGSDVVPAGPDAAPSGPDPTGLVRLPRRAARRRFPARSAQSGRTPRGRIRLRAERPENRRSRPCRLPVSCHRRCPRRSTNVSGPGRKTASGSTVALVPTYLCQSCRHGGRAPPPRRSDPALGSPAPLKPESGSRPQLAAPVTKIRFPTPARGASHQDQVIDSDLRRPPKVRPLTPACGVGSSGSDRCRLRSSRRRRPRRRRRRCR